MKLQEVFLLGKCQQIFFHDLRIAQKLPDVTEGFTLENISLSNISKFEMT